MRPANRMALFAATAIVAFCLAKPSRAGSIYTYDKVIDLGSPLNLPYGNQPSIDAEGNLDKFPTGQAGVYSLGTVFDTKSGHAVVVSHYLHQSGSDANLLPPSLQSPDVEILGINSSGNLVGTFLGLGGNSFFFSLATGQVSTPFSLGGGSHQVLLNGLNDLNQMVGTQDNGGPIFFAGPTSVPVPLSSLVSLNSGWTLLTATGIDDRGDVVGLGINPAGQTADFELVPAATVPEPSSLFIFGSAFVLVVGWRRMRGRQRILAD